MTNRSGMTKEQLDAILDEAFRVVMTRHNKEGKK